MSLIWLVAAWLVGIGLALKAGLPATAVGGWWAIALVGLTALLVTRRVPGWRLFFGCMLAFGLGAARFGLTSHTVSADQLEYYNDRGAQQLTGLVVDMPDVHDSSVHLRVEMQSIRDGKTERPISGLALVEADRFGEYAYGDKLQIDGTPQTPPRFDTFSFRDYLARGNVYTLILSPKVTRLETDQGSPVLAASFDLRNRAHQLINRMLPSPQSALLTGILLGINSDIPPEVSNAFSVTGTSHIIAISGSNITIVAGLLFVLFGRLKSKALAAVLMLIGLVVYTFFVGASPSVVRAAIMGGLAVVAARLGRQNDGLTALAFAVWLQTLINPLVIDDVGLVLSSLATLGLILFTQPLTDLAHAWLKRVFAENSARLIADLLAEFVLITLAAQLTTLPIIMLIFGQFSLVSFVVNLLIVPAQASIMALGILSVFAGALLFPVGQIIGWLVGLPLSYTLAIIRAAAQLPSASVAVSVEPGWIIGYYALVLGAVTTIRQAQTRRIWLERARRWATPTALIAFGSGTAILIWAMVLARPDGKLHVWFLDVGGNAVLVRTPNGANILIDGGPNPTQLRTALGDRLPFYQRDLDVLIVTEPTQAAALSPIFDRYLPRMVLSSGLEKNSTAYQALMDALTAHHLQATSVQAGYQMMVDDGLTLQFLHPQAVPASDAKPDDSALVIRLAYKGASFLLTSQLSAQAESEMLAAGWYAGAAVVQLPSHAAEAANSTDFLKAVSPQVAVFEAEAGSRTEKPSETALQRLGSVPIYRTDKQGTIEMISDGQQLWIQPSFGQR